MSTRTLDAHINCLWRDAMWHADRAQTLFGYARVLYREYKSGNLSGQLIPWQAGIFFHAQKRLRSDAMMHLATAKRLGNAAFSQGSR